MTLLSLCIQHCLDNNQGQLSAQGTYNRNSSQTSIMCLKKLSSITNPFLTKCGCHIVRLLHVPLYSAVHSVMDLRIQFPYPIGCLYTFHYLCYVHAAMHQGRRCMCLFPGGFPTLHHRFNKQLIIPRRRSTLWKKGLVTFSTNLRLSCAERWDC